MMTDFLNLRFLRDIRTWKRRLPPEQFEAVATTILRVPGYFVLNSWWQLDLLNCVPRSAAWSDVVPAGFAAFVMVQGLLLLLLPFPRLVQLYMHYLSVAVMAGSDHFSRYYVDTEARLVAEQPGYEHITFQGFAGLVIPHRPLFAADPLALYLRQQMSAIVFHTLAALGVTFCLDIGDTKAKVVLLVYYLPVFARLAGTPVHHLHSVHTASSCFVLLLTAIYIFMCLPHVLQFSRDTYLSLKRRLQLYGEWSFVVRVANRLFVPFQILVFWMFQYVCGFHAMHMEGNQSTPTNLTTTPGPGLHTLLHPAAHVCDNILMLVATCVAISYAARLLLATVHCYMVGHTPRLVPHHGDSEGLVMFVLSLQTSLHSTPVPERYGLFSVLLLIVSSSLIQSTFEVVEPHVVALSAQGVVSLSRHFRVVTTCLTLFILPMYMVYVFNLIFEHDFWLLLVMSSSGMIAVQVLGLLVTYSLLTYDSLCCEEWPGLDDVIYYSRATSRAVEFIVAVVVVSAGVKDALVGGQRSPMNIVILLIYFYFNVFDRLQQGWKSFLLRLESAKKIGGLPQANPTQLREYDDVCAICYGALRSGCVTSCAHIFHAACLRKWLYVQDKCPLCQRVISVPEKEETGGSLSQTAADDNPNAARTPQYATGTNDNQNPQGIIDETALSNPQDSTDTTPISQETGSQETLAVS